MKAQNDFELCNRILEGLSEGVGVVRVKDRRILRTNAAFAEILRFRGADLIGQTIDPFLILGGSSAERHILRVSQRFQEEGGFVRLEAQARRRGDEIFWASLCLKRILDDQGDEIWIVEISDITEKKRIESQLKLNSEILAGTPDFVAVAEASTSRLTFMNEAGRRLMGLAPDADLANFKIQDFVPNDQLKYVQNEVLPSLIQAGLWEGELRIRSRKGKEVPVLSVLQAHRDQKGALKFISNISRDLTERIAQEAARAEDMAELEELYNNASCGYHSLDTLGLVVRMNDLELRWLGYHRDEVVGKMHVSQLLAPESLPIFHEHFPRIQAGLEIENVEVFFRRKDGTTFPALLSATAARDYSGRFLHSRTMVIDLSRIKRLEAEKDLANQQLQHGARLVSLGEMAAGMAHEINQPLAHIALTGQLIRGLQEAGRLTQDELLSLVDGMEASIARATRVINRVQLFGRRQAPELCSVDLNQTIRTALDLMSKQLRVEGIQVERDLSERLPRLLSDPHQLEQVWVNQITNARDALLEKAQTMGLAQTEVGPRRLVVRTRCAEEALWIEFENNGVGMSEETKQKLFQPFFTTKPPGRGTGLGLSISFSIMRGLGGTISVDSELGVGSRLTFRLPLAEVQP